MHQSGILLSCLPRQHSNIALQLRLRPSKWSACWECYRGLQARQTLHLRWSRQQREQQRRGSARPGMTQLCVCPRAAVEGQRMLPWKIQLAMQSPRQHQQKDPADSERARAHSEPAPCWCPSAWHSWRRISSTSACRGGIRPRLHPQPMWQLKPLLHCSSLLQLLQVADSTSGMRCTEIPANVPGTYVLRQHTQQCILCLLGKVRGCT